MTSSWTKWADAISRRLCLVEENPAMLRQYGFESDAWAWKKYTEPENVSLVLLRDL